MLILFQTMISQTDKITGNEFEDLSIIFEPSIVQVDIMDDWTYNPRYNQLFDKIDSLYNLNPKWLDKYFAKIKDYDPLYYDKRFGLSKEEFQEFLELDKEQGPASSGTSRLEIVVDDKSKIISFKGSSDLSYLLGLEN
tara:strand:- start:419 stop:832 length:414 start_codon:yes stop_codon:yes gene_type:complete